MNNLQKELQDLKAKVIELELRISAEPVAKWQPEGGNWWIDEGGEVVEGHTSSPSIEFGVERPTRQQAQRAAVEMRKFNRLLALRDELCGDGESDWGSVNGEYYIYFYNEDNKWHTDCDHPRYVTPYFTTQESAQRACNMLNSGEVEL